MDTKDKDREKKVEELVKQLNEELRKGGFTSLILIGHNTSKRIQKTFVCDCVTNGKDPKDSIDPDQILFEALAGDEPGDISLRTYVFNGILNYLESNMPALIQFEDAYIRLLDTIAKREGWNMDEDDNEVPNFRPNPNAEC